MTAARFAGIAAISTSRRPSSGTVSSVVPTVKVYVSGSAFAISCAIPIAVGPRSAAIRNGASGSRTAAGAHPASDRISSMTINLFIIFSL
jgi:hypothetical protein